MKRLTKRQLEILQGIARGGVLEEPSWNYSRHFFRFRGSHMHAAFHRKSAVNNGHRLVTVGLIDKMVARGLIEKFKPHAGMPCYRLTVKGGGQLADSGV